jgi:HEAT repeat protein
MKTNNAIYSLLVLLLICSYAACFGASENSQDDAVAMILDILRSDDQQMQTVAISMIRDLQGTKVTEALAEELPNLSITSQMQLISALGDRGDSAALPAVVNAIKSSEPSVRIAALKALRQLGGASSVNLLAKTAASTKGQEQKAARDSLYRLRGPGVDETILESIPKTEAQIKVELIGSVGERNITGGINVLLKTAKDSDGKVRVESFRALKVIADPEHLPALVDILTSLNSSSEINEAQTTIAAIARKIEDKNRQSESVLTALASATDIQSRCSLLGVLGKIGDSKSLPVLTAALKDENVDVKAAAIRALTEWPNPEPLPDLMKVAESSESKIHRILALRASVYLLRLESERPAEESIEIYHKAMNLAPDASEKKRVLSGLAEVKSLGALQIAMDYLDDETLCREAELAVIKIADNIYREFTKQAQNALKKIVQDSKNDMVRKQAQEQLNQIEGFLKFKETIR